MEAREQYPAAVEETAAAETATEGATAPQMTETADRTMQSGAEARPEAPGDDKAQAEAPAPSDEAEDAVAADAGALARTAKPATDAPLELVELELALSLADIPAAGFDMAMRAALASAGGTLLFIMPVGGEDMSVAALSLGSGAERETFLAILGADGETVRFEKASESRHPIAGLAASWTRVMERMPVAA